MLAKKETLIPKNCPLGLNVQWRFSILLEQRENRMDHKTSFWALADI